MDIHQIRDLVDLVVESGITELEVEHEGMAVRIRSHGPCPTRPGAGEPLAAAQTAAGEHSRAGREPDTTSARPVAAGMAVTSPMVGTFFSAPEPGAPDFVEVGQRVSPGDTLCLIEAMKVLNEIEAEFPAIILEVCAQNGQPVEAEAVLFRIEPV